MEFNRLLSSAISTYGEIDFENENKDQAQRTKDNLSKSKYNLIKSEDELKKLIENTNWKPHYSLDKGLIETINWLEENKKLFKH